jgi:transcriptional regulator with XRE-family HTH domain
MLRYAWHMPVAPALKVEALSKDFHSQRKLAAALGVSPAQVSRWRRGQGIDSDNAERLDLLELVMSSLLRLYEPETAEKWLFGLNPLLRHRRPIDVIRQGRPEELLAAIRQEQADSYA